MKKTKESIIKKREEKKKYIQRSEKVRMEKKYDELRNKAEWEYEKAIIKAEKKSKAYLNKKFLEYDRKCKNEIRKLE